MKKISLVTGANGHLGNNLVRELLKRDEKVRASVRDLNDKKPFEGLDCEVVYADLMDKESLIRALDGVDTLYQVAAVFKHWAKDPEKEIINPNVLGTQNIMEAAKEAKVRRIVYVSSVAALSLNKTNSKDKIDETTWLEDSHGNAYFDSKARSEKMAWELAKKYDLDMVSVLPGAMIGGEFLKKTPTMLGFDSILLGKMKINYITEMTPIDVNDVTDGMIAAAEKGIKGTRYILANEEPVTSDDIIKNAKKFVPDLEIPQKYTKEQLLLLADRLELEAKQNNTQPLILRSQVELYYGGINRHYDITTSRKDLNFNPKLGGEALEEYFKRVSVGLSK
ncbi:NAD-dependent epimerase/dehydratase family protein [Clostridium chromiireducens]|uniref:NAD-dependent epimerase/dehydratase family protein n=1 Tax=Clostridium chromiireducens TaxID=225345 RepID=A0A964RPF4_9CLOT|nr:NAD-dependent epimerase/dehydratase family protein [Clostridium chromiireducens]MVX65300.1 NAD-dependent epimerase/dehydratase family protein [Clostridium chromiireducens]